MTAENFEAVMEEILRHEGGLSMVRSDPGNWTGGKVGKGQLRGTKYGIAAHANPSINIEALTKPAAREIYRRKYWRMIAGDNLRAGIDLVTMDPAVNSGVSRGVRWLQQAVGVTADGQMGPKTIAAANSANVPDAIRRACAARMGFLRGLGIWSKFGRGWSARVASVEAVALRMSIEAAGLSARPALIEAQAGAAKAQRRDQGAAGGSAVTGGGTLTFADVPEWALWLGAALVLLVVINQIGRARVHQIRAQAFQAVAVEARA